MFLCIQCHDYPDCLSQFVSFRSLGKCEGCGVVAECVDCHTLGCKITPRKEK